MMGPVKERNGLTEAEDIKKCQEYTKNCTIKGLNDPDTHDGVINHLEPDILEYKDKWAFSSIQFSCSVVSNSLRPHGLQHARLSCQSPNPGVYSNLRPLSRCCHPTISSSVIPLSSPLQSFPASRSFPMSQFLHQVAKVIKKC